MQIDTLRIGHDNYSYIISDNGIAAVIDPGDAGPVNAFIKKSRLRLDFALITHNHGDHSGGAGQLERSNGCRVIYPQDCAGASVDGIAVIGSLQIRAFATPGHTAHDVCFHVPQLNAVFTGDTMFAAGCGRLLGGSAAQMWNSLNKIAALGDSTLVYCGHEYTEENLRFALTLEPDHAQVMQRLDDVKALLKQKKPSVPSLIAREKETNPFLRASEPGLKAVLGMSGASDSDVLAEIRRRKDSF